MAALQSNRQPKSESGPHLIDKALFTTHPHSEVAILSTENETK
jgi:hypothetical protein